MIGLYGWLSGANRPLSVPWHLLGWLVLLLALVLIRPKRGRR
jgi:hypothetical protein